MLPVYVRKKPEEFDKKVISKLPFIPMWISIANIVKAKFDGTMDNISYLQYDINVN